MKSALKQEDAPGGCCASSTVTHRRIALTDLRPGQVGVVQESALEESDAAFLRAMGLCNDARVRVSRTGEPCIVIVNGSNEGCGCGSTCRIGLARPLAQKIFVTVGE